MGYGAVLDHALRDLMDLPRDSWEHTAALPVLARLRFEMPEDPHGLTAEEKELAVTSQQIVETLQREAREQGIEQGIERGIEQGIEQGAAHAFALLFERRLQRKLREAERARLRERVEILGPARVSDIVLDLPVGELAEWLANPHAHVRALEVRRVRVG
jgi:flagellar biosynthesis/type III secretory pathway protein FliH